MERTWHIYNQRILSEMTSIYKSVFINYIDSTKYNAIFIMPHTFHEDISEDLAIE